MVNTIMLLLSCIADTYLMCLFFLHFLEERKFLANRTRKYIFYTIFIGAWFLGNILGNGDYNLIVSGSLILAYTLFILSGKWQYKLFCFVLLIIIQFGCEFLFMIIFQPHSEAYKSSPDIFVQLVAIKFLTYIVIILVTQFIGKSNKRMSGNILALYLCLPIASITVMVVNYYTGVYRTMTERMIIPVLLGYCFLFVGNVVVFYAFHIHSENLAELMEQQVLLTKQEADLALYNRAAQMDESQKELIHNTKHYISLMRKYAKEENIEAILNMTSQLSGEIEAVDKKIFTNNAILNTVLNEKYEEAIRHEIEVDFYVEPGIVLEHVSAIDLVCMVGNLLDNAIRAASMCTGKKFVKAYVYMQDIGGFCVVKVVNGFSNELLYEDGVLKTTKKEKGIHGIGVRSVNRLAEEYGGMLVCTPKGNLFEAILMLSTM